MTSSRRSFIKFAAFLPTAIYLTQCKTVGRTGVGSSSYLKVSPTNSYVPKRVSWTSLSAADRQAFIDAVKKMKGNMIEVPADFGEGGARQLDQWAAQAEVHNWYCPHMTWDFLPWHRAYLYHFELALRKLIRDDFRLPYWDWSKDQEIPKELQDAELIATLGINRESTTIAVPGNPGDQQTAAWWAAAFTDISTGKDFDSIGGDVESNGVIEGPYHNMVHVGVGGFMGQVAMAAHDPVFWLHHCNVDRLWSLWMDQLIEKDNIRAMFPSLDVPTWLAQNYANNFWTPESKLVSSTNKQSLFTEDMGYNYDTMKKTWTLSDIPPDLPVAEVPAPVEKVGNAATTTPATLKLADIPGSTLALQFVLPAAVFNGPQPLLSLRLKLAGIPEPADRNLSYSVSLVVQGKTLPLPEIVFFQGHTATHKKGLIGINLNKHLSTIAALPEGKRTVQLVLILKNKQGKAQPIPNPSTDVNRYQVKVKAVFK